MKVRTEGESLALGDAENRRAAGRRKMTNTMRTSSEVFESEQARDGTGGKIYHERNCGGRAAQQKSEAAANRENVGLKRGGRSPVRAATAKQPERVT